MLGQHLHEGGKRLQVEDGHHLRQCLLIEGSSGWLQIGGMQARKVASKVGGPIWPVVLCLT